MKNQELLAKYKEKLLFLKSKLNEEYEELSKKNSHIEKLRLLFESSGVNDYTNVIIKLPLEEVLEYAKYVGINCTMDELTKYRFIVTESAFRSSYRYKEAKGYFDNIALKLRNESLKRVKTDRVDYLKDTVTYIDYLLTRIVTGKIKGPIDDISKAMDLFDLTPLNGFTEAEKKYLVKQLVVADLNNLVKESENIEEKVYQDQEADLNRDEEIIIPDEPVKEEIKEEETEEVAIEEPKEEKPVRTYRSVIAQEKINLLNIIGLYADGIIDTYTPKTATHEEYLHKIVPQIVNGELTIEMLRDVLIVDKQYAYVLAIYLRDLVLSLNDFLNTKEEEKEELVNELFDEQMVQLNAVYYTLKDVIEQINKSYEKEELVEEQVPDNGKYILLFVRTGLESYFYKSLFELRSNDNLGNIERMLVDLENGNFANDRKIKEFHYKTKGSFAIFYKIKSGHVLVFNIMLVRDISNKRTDNILSLLDSVNEVRLIRERTPEYDKLVEDSEKEREELRVMLGVATSGVQL